MSDLYEALPAATRDRALMSASMRPLDPSLRMAGPAITALCAPRDNLMMHRALLLAMQGDVLVVAASGGGAQWGTLAARYAARIGLGGVVVDGCIRDTPELLAQRAAVWAKRISAEHPDKRGAGAVNVPIQCDGVRVRPGDVVCADGDGVLVVPAELLAQTVAKAEERAVHESAAAKEIDAGQNLFVLHGLDAAYGACGAAEVDRCWDE
ncbi:MAG: RraA family protein [Betaproteobacteria bacterium]|nr:RraA family protein [Betaproteobacteria bacterium]